MGGESGFGRTNPRFIAPTKQRRLAPEAGCGLGASCLLVLSES
jgi:hypothetical protein